MPPVLNTIYEVITPIILIAALGIWFGRRAGAESRTLSRAGIYLFIPCLTFQSIATSDLNAGELGRLVLLVGALTVLMLVVGQGVVRLHRSFDAHTRGAFLLSILLLNSGNYGLPLVEFAFGREGLQHGVIVVVLMSLITNTLGIFVASRGSSSFRQAVLNVFRVPLPYAVTLGFIVRMANITLPVPLERSIGLLAQAAVPTLLLLLGVQLSHISLRSDGPGRLRGVMEVALIRLLLAPVLVYVLTGLLGISGLVRQVVFVQLSMPTAVNAALLATEFGSDAKFVTAAILVSTLASIITLSVLLSIAPI